MITGKHFIDLGYKPGSWFPAAIAEANSIEEADLAAIAMRHAPPPAIGLRSAGSLPYHINIEAEDAHETANIDTVEPIGNIMAGDWQRNAPWRNKRR